MRLHRKICSLIVLVAAALLVSPTLRAQDNSENPGVNQGNYNIQQSIEIGYRANWINGNQDTYDTFINLGSGVRLLDYSVDMRSLDHNGFLFDNLSMSSFGYGGDPNDVTRLRIDKNKWYDFRGLFRRDKNFWNYNLFENPLNPSNITPAVAITTSPAAMDTVRRMQDYSLTLLPQSRIRFRLGYSRNVNEGPELSSLDSGVAPQLTSFVRTTVNAYRAGIDFRVLPKTTFSYDQFLEYDKEDDNTSDLNRTFQLSNGAPVDLGIVWSGGAEVLPCAAPIADPTTTPVTANPSCNGILSYSRVQRPRNFVPTEQLRFQSSYFRNFDMSGAVSYSTSKNQIPDFLESISGLTTRNASLGSTTGGPAIARRVSASADWSGVYSVTDKFRILDTFRYLDWRIPGMWDLAETTVFDTAGPGFPSMLLPVSQFTPSTFASVCPPPFTATTCPQHTSGSAADFTNGLSESFLGQNLKENTFQLQYDFTRHLTGRIGYVYEARRIAEFNASFDSNETYYPGGPAATPVNDFLAARGACALQGGLLPIGCTANPDGSITYCNFAAACPANTGSTAANDASRQITNVDESALLFGLTARFTDAFRIDGDFEVGHNTNAYTRTSPNKLQIYKVHATYKPRPWVNLNAALDIQNNGNDLLSVLGTEHIRTYSFMTMFLPNSRLSFELGYNYNDVYSQAEICFAYSTVPATPSPFGPCPILGSPVALGALGNYSSKQHFAYGAINFKPVKRVTTSLGYTGTFVGGSTLIINQLQPAGTLAFNYQKPYAMFQFDIYKGLSYKMSWDYYGYNGKGPLNIAGLQPIPSADFNGSTATFAFRYMF
jgi:hypothetical protein